VIYLPHTVHCEANRMSKSRSRPVHQCQCEVCQRHRSSQVARRHKALNRVIADCDEKTRRRLVGLLAQQWGPQCVSQLHRITGLSRNTIQRGRYEIMHPVLEPAHRIRCPGAGRVAVEKNSPASSRRWTNCSRMRRRATRLPV
jgi:hypothetical protein